MSSPASNSAKPRLIVIDDEVNMGRILTRIFTMEDFDVVAFSSSTKALEAILEDPPDLVLSDIRMPELTGEELLEKLKENKVPTRVILMTAHATIESAIRSVKLGAFDYTTKPFDTANLIELVKRGLASRPLAEASAPRAPQKSIPQETPKPETGDAKPPVLTRAMVGKAPAFIKARKLIERIAPTESPVLITGESGTGKEVAARALHDLSERRTSNFVAINCASIPENLIESELFGHAKGAFTGAHSHKIGLVEMANGGTLFLDEIGELPLNLQSKLLRVLQEREITRVGETDPVYVDIRILSATNRNLKQCVKEKTFREDLYYRLNVIAIELPALRDRKDDILDLTNHFLKQKAKQHRRDEMELTQEAEDWLRKLRFPGNIRELENLIEHAVLMTEGPMIDIFDFPADIGASSSEIFISGENLDKLARSAETMVRRETDFKKARDLFERQYLTALLKASNFNVSEAAKKASMSRRNLYEKIEKLEIDIEELKSDRIT